MADFKDVLNTTDTTAEFDKDDIQKNKVMAVLSYLGILVLIPIFAAKDSKYARYHANQGLLLWIANMISSVVFGILGFIAGIILGVTGVTIIVTVVNLLSWVVSIVFFALMILGIVNAATDKAKELPIIGKFKLLK